MDFIHFLELFLFNGERYKILKAEKSHTNGEPGSVISEDLEICCGEGSIKVLIIQREGKRVQQINEFLLGNQIKKAPKLLNVQVSNIN